MNFSQRQGRDYWLTAYLGSCVIAQGDQMKMQENRIGLEDKDPRTKRIAKRILD